MFQCKIADLVISVSHRYELVLRRCRDYLCDNSLPPDIFISLTEEERSAEDATASSPAYAEYIAIYRKLCAAMLAHEGFLLHCAVISLDGRGYAFTAPSGTGKSTHIALWRRVFGARVGIVNGDKPILRKHAHGFTAYGTPWCGKEGWQKNTSVPISALAFLERGESNRIARLSPEEAFPRLLQQVTLPEDANALQALLDLLEVFVHHTPLFLLTCNMEEEAAKVAYDAMVTQSN